MAARLIEKAALESWVEALIREYTVFGAQARGDRFAFGPLATASDLRLDYDVTILPPKKYFLPQREVLNEYDRYNVRFKSVLKNEPTVLFGVHPYDMAAISLMDRVFSMDHFDVHYMTRRKNTAVVVVDTQNASNDVFASFMGCATVDNLDGFDVLLTYLEDGTYVVDVKSAKGEVLMDFLTGSGEADEECLEKRRSVWDRNKKLMRKHELQADPTELPMILERSHDHPVWEELAERCYSCGSCNLVCPTCYCFDVQDDLNWDMETGIRSRTWGACMLAGFSRVAGGHNFRAKKSDRFRHRLFRKGKYSWDTIGKISCVGCGRCISACTARIANPVKIFNRLQSDT